MGLILGIGFPPFRGGLLRWADSLGMDKVLAQLKRYESLGPRFHPTEQRWADSLGPDKILTWRVFITEPPHRDKTL